MNEVTVTKRGADRIRRGHLWIYRSDIVNTNDVAGGSIVVVLDQGHNFGGQAFFSDSSQIALRLLSLSEKTLDRDWWRQRIANAAGRRKSLINPNDSGKLTNAYRLIYSEGDLLPSIIVDRY